MYVYKQNYPVFRNKRDEKTGDWSIEPVLDTDETGEEKQRIQPWVSLDPHEPDLERFPRFADAPVIECRVHAGETLYLPAMWYHRVTQETMIIAVNQWFDMRFDHPQYHLLKLAEAVMQSEVDDTIYF